MHLKQYVYRLLNMELEIAEIIKIFEREDERTVSQNTGLRFVCDDCGHGIFGEEDGYVFCAACGTTKSKSTLNCMIEFGQNNDGTRTHDRCGHAVNPLIPNAGMSTKIVSGRDDRIKQLQIWGSSNHKDQSKLRMLSVVYAKCTKSNVSMAIMREIETLAVEVCDRMIDLESVYRGKLRQGLIAACFFFAFKKTGNARSCSEIATLLDSDIIVVIRGLKLYSDLFQHKKLVYKDQTADLLEYLPRFCNRLHIPNELEQLMGNLCDSIGTKELLRNHTVEAKIAACIYFVINGINLEAKVSRQEISAVCNVSEMTIAKCLKELQTNMTLRVNR